MNIISFLVVIIGAIATIFVAVKLTNLLVSVSSTFFLDDWKKFEKGLVTRRRADGTLYTYEDLTTYVANAVYGVHAKPTPSDDELNIVENVFDEDEDEETSEQVEVLLAKLESFEKLNGLPSESNIDVESIGMNFEVDENEKLVDSSLVEDDIMHDYDDEQLVFHQSLDGDVSNPPEFHIEDTTGDVGKLFDSYDEEENEEEPIRNLTTAQFANKTTGVIQLTQLMQ